MDWNSLIGTLKPLKSSQLFHTRQHESEHRNSLHIYASRIHETNYANIPNCKLTMEHSSLERATTADFS